MLSSKCVTHILAYAAMSIIYVYPRGIRLSLLQSLHQKFVTHLKVLFAPHEVESRLGVHIALHVELTSQNLGTAKEDAGFSSAMNLPYTPEDHIPIWPAEIRWRA